MSLPQKAGFVLINLWLAFHVFAVFIAPAGMPPSSPLLVDISRLALPYNQLMFLNHGYHYFAPDPGASTLISWQVDRPGDLPLKGRFPDTSIHPRLLYHRYFMLAENVGAFPEATQEKIYRAYARHFAEQNRASAISLSAVSHQPSSIARIQAGGRLSDPETYQEQPLSHFDFSDSAESNPAAGTDVSTTGSAR